MFGAAPTFRGQYTTAQLQVHTTSCDVITTRNGDEIHFDEKSYGKEKRCEVRSRKLESEDVSKDVYNKHNT